MTGKSAKRQAALRARRAKVGIHEVRGIWAQKNQHAAIIDAARNPKPAPRFQLRVSKGACSFFLSLGTEIGVEVTAASLRAQDLDVTVYELVSGCIYEAKLKR